MKIVVLDGYTFNPDGDNPWDPVAALGELTVYDRTPEPQVIERAHDATILLTNKTRITAAELAQLAHLKFISVLATGYNVVDVSAARERRIPVSNVPEYGTGAVAQHVFAVLLNAIHRPREHDSAIRDGEWKRRGDFCFWLSPITELAGKTMGIVGMGRIGGAVARLASAFAMKVIAYDVARGSTPAVPGMDWVSMAELFARSDVVSLHCPLTDDNHQFVNQSLLNLMKPNAILINAARGGLVHEQDLADALNSAQIAAACLDVFSQEPIAAANPLLSAKNCLLTPHYAWSAVEARRRLMRFTAGNIAAFQNGNPINIVN